MGKQSEREQQIADLTAEGWPLADIRTILRHAATLHHLAELACSSEAADRDRVPCPGANGKRCLCDEPSQGQHESVPRIDVRADRIGDAVHRLAVSHGGSARIDGDPRGYIVKLILPSGRNNTMGGREAGYGVG